MIGDTGISVVDRYRQQLELGLEFRSMIRKIPAVVILWCILGLVSALGQQIVVNRQNKTIAITADDSVSVDPEVATITVGYQNYAPAKDAAYEENVRVSNK